MSNTTGTNGAKVVEKPVDVAPLFDANLAWAERIAQSFCAREGVEASSRDAVMNAARWGLYLACVNSGNVRGTFRTYARRYVICEIRSELRGDSENRARAYSGVIFVEMPEEISTKTNAEIDSVDMDRILSRLTPRLSFVLRRRYLDGLSIRELSAEMGVTYERVRQLESQALQRAYRALPKDYSVN